jgi:hypothetical protein
MKKEALLKDIEKNRSLTKRKKDFLLGRRTSRIMNKRTIWIIGIIIVILIVFFPWGNLYAKSKGGLNKVLSNFDDADDHEHVDPRRATILAHAAAVHGKPNSLGKVLNDFDDADDHENVDPTKAAILAHAAAVRGGKNSLGKVLNDFDDADDHENVDPTKAAILAHAAAVSKVSKKKAAAASGVIF